MPYAQENAREDPGNDRHRGRDQQHRRRIPDHRPHVENVQSQRAKEIMTRPPGMEHIIEITYLIATALFILSLKWLSSPKTARRGVFAGELGMLLAIVGTLL